MVEASIYRKYLRGIVGFFLMMFSILACNNLQKKSDFQLRNGDLLFQDLDDSSLSEAIERVTEEGQAQLSFSHVGMFMQGEKGEALVLEAISEGVSITPLDTFLVRSRTREGNSKVVVGRIKEEFRDRIAPALEYGQLLLGRPYDSVYVMKDSAYYCSELIYEMFQEGEDREEVFHLNPMTFKDPDTGKFISAWVEHYRELGVPIPEGQPGLNPNGMSRSKNIELIYSFVTGDRILNK